ncbi:MAG TPA: hypothetical protein VL985_01215 [Stellaceae bacterium]|nr:hypothetical protein [Stellaceae bacterium]
MRVPAFPIVASLVLLAAPAFAQNGAQNGAMTGNPAVQNGTSGYTNNSNTGYTSNDTTNGGPGDHNGWNGADNGSMPMNTAAGPAWSNGSNVSQDTRTRIRQSLAQSGFRDVTVRPEAFVIHATAPDGSRVVMLLRPDEVTGVIAQSGTSTGGTNYDNGNGGNNGAANMNNGSGNNDNGNGTVR